MDDRCFLADSVALAHINGVRVSVPNQFDRRERVIPSEIHPTDARPMAGEIGLLAGKHLFSDGEDAARAQGWYAFRERLAFMRRIRGGDPLFLLSAVVLDIIERHRHDAATGGRLEQKPPYDLAHAEQRGERHPYRTLVDVRARQAFGVDV